MAVTQETLLRQLATSISDLLHLCALKPLQFLFKPHSSSLLNKSKLLLILFQEISNSPLAPSPSHHLFFSEIRHLLIKINDLLFNCSNSSKVWSLLQYHKVAQSFYALHVELATLLDIFPLRDFHMDDDVADIVFLLRKQCYEATLVIDRNDDVVRIEVWNLLEGIKRGIAPDIDNLHRLFSNLGLIDSLTRREEIDRLEEELREKDQEKKNDVVLVLGFIRYANCVLYGEELGKSSANKDTCPIPVDFRCPISLELMRDPVVVSTGQTYDKNSIIQWVESGHDTCPKTGQSLEHKNLIPNVVMKNVISSWCREKRIPFEVTERVKSASGVVKLSVSFLVEKLRDSKKCDERANRFIHELRVLAKSDKDSREFMAKAGVIPILGNYLGSDVPNLQVNAVTTILNLSILLSNKDVIMESQGVLDGVIEVLNTGATWEAKGNAAATIFSLTSVHTYLVELGSMPRVIKGLVCLGRDGPTCYKRDALVAIMNLAKERENVVRLVEEGVVEMACDAMEELQEGTVNVLELVVKKGGLMGISASYMAIRKLGEILRFGSDRAREGAAGILVSVCRGGGWDAVAELAGIPGIERVIWELMGTGTERGRRKSASLLRILRKWAGGLDGDFNTRGEFESRLLTNSEV